LWPQGAGRASRRYVVCISPGYWIPPTVFGGGGILFDDALKETMTASFQILANCIQSSFNFMPCCVVVEVVTA